MPFAELADVRLEGGGVMFQYLLLELTWAAQKKAIVRGLNYKPYAGKTEERVVKWAKEELGESGLFESGGDFQIRGGGSVAFNTYYETITVFGSSQTYGVEEDREAVVKLIETSYPEHEVSWFNPESRDSTSKE
ncbi:MAG: hypothetical protein O7D93_04680 [Acidobacteria bacterium]|nr:hypothetical protein [Acidobacteriota bacterium]MCZ6878534.1 hypothetical protein [Acidobacteriota bacterium]